MLSPYSKAKKGTRIQTHTITTILTTITKKNRMTRMRRRKNTTTTYTSKKRLSIIKAFYDIVLTVDVWKNFVLKTDIQNFVN